MTGESYTGAALLAQDRMRAGHSREKLREGVRELSGWNRFVRTATARFGYEGLCSQEECAIVCHDAEAQKDLRQCKGPWLYLSLEAYWRGACLTEFPTAAVVSLCRMDRDGPLPFIQRHIWAALLTTLAIRFQTEPTAANEKAALACRDHYIWRVGQVDAVWIPEERNSSRLPQLCVRASLQEPRSPSLKWVSVSGETLSVPNQNAAELCSTESQESRFVTPYGHAQWYGSRSPVQLQGVRLWRKRRADAPPPFPDNDGASTLDGSTTSSESSLSDDSSSTDGEAEPEADSFDGGGPPVPPETVESKKESVTCIPCDLTILEQAILALPEGFRYIPRVTEADVAVDETCAVAVANSALVAGFVARSSRRVRRRVG